MKKYVLAFKIFSIFSYSLAAQTQSAMESFWEKAVAGVVIGAPSAQAGSVVIALDGGSVKAYSWQGALLWEYFAAGKLCPFLTRSWYGVSYVCRTNGSLFALNRVGKELWRVNLNAPITAPVIVGWDGRIFVPTERVMFCFNAEGKSLWTRRIDGKTIVPPILDKQGGILFAIEGGVSGGAGGKIVQISAFGKTTGIGLARTPAVLVSIKEKRKEQSGEDAVLVWYKDGAGDIFTHTGEAFEKARAFSQLSASPLAASEYNGGIAAALSNGSVILLSTEGEIRWKTDAGLLGAEETTLINREDGVYVLSVSRAAGFHRNGALKWKLNIQNAAAMPAFGKDGVLYSGGRDWMLYAYQLEYADGRLWETSRYGAAPQGDYGLGELPPQRSNYYNQFSDFDITRQFNKIREKIEQGQLGEDEPGFIVYLKEVASSARNSLSIPATQPPVSLVRRVEAARLLASFGSHELIPFFADLFLNDKEPQVKAAVAEAIGRIGVDPDGIAMRAFAQTIAPPVVCRDERTLAAVAVAVGSLCRVSGPPVISFGVTILVGLAASDKPPLVRKKAMLELSRLQS
ncbi:MAG: PQQ-binding-like beta-propeller repeat protein [Treponema sp.]|jgi:outer membrane protein assembly factor BamB|nr:PQQ-binding-like beta-propeller repeat protein [Treponema sp.]